MASQERTREHDPIQRGIKAPSPTETTTFFLGRLADPFIQYGFLKRDWGRPLITRLRGTTLPQGPPLITHTAFDRLGLSPYRTILWAMSFGSMLKQNYHLTTIMQERIKPGFGAQVALFNCVGNTLNSLFFVCAQTSASVNGEHFPQTPLIVGSALYVVGLLVEVVSEQQRHNWKKRPQNRGQLYVNGLFGTARHINYFGYMMWRTGYALAAGGWAWAAFVAGLSTWQFTRLTIPAHQQYMEEKYGEQFQAYERATPYKFIPWVY
ncbi:hypothetical protein DOTSEDRAFT_174057 [Dothistroma septosporum NZE10]|uniref:Uncharacterized protein n=1 Tax=Dothistroma septosporum (strain NZE10 / CBS 128990) TaxID=675120 RepID=M2XLG8_DOTSN|nr:hypothetical protein DOTSEDRAFT_174057 [Dothistroma septosporum NZE10]